MRALKPLTQLATLGTVFAAIVGAGWYYHVRIVDGVREDMHSRVESERTHARELRELDTKRIEAERQKEIALLAARNEADRSQATSAVEGLRRELAAARSTVQLQASGGSYISVNDLVIDEHGGRTLAATPGYRSVRRFVVPDYSDRAWQWFDGISLRQLEALLEKQEILLRPPEAEIDPTDLGWIDIVDVFAKRDTTGEAIVGICSFDISTVDAVMSVVTKANAPKNLAGLPIGMIGHFFAMEFVGGAHGDGTNLTVREFSAKEDAYFLTTTTVSANREYLHEVLITREGKTILIAFASYSSKDLLNPIRKEASDWIKALRIVRAR